MSLTLHAPSLQDVHVVRQWRAQVPETLRTPFALTARQQEAFYVDVCSDRRSPHRYWSVHDLGRDELPTVETLVAFTSLEHISFENGHAEIGLIVDPARQGQGIGQAAVDLVLGEAFDRLRLWTCWGESYLTNERSADFWRAVVKRYQGSVTIWERRKFWNGQLFDALLFTLTLNGWRASKEAA